MTPSTWILVCDASRARLFHGKRGKQRAAGLEQLQELEHADSRARGRDLTADAPGRKPVGPVPARSGNHGGAHGRPGAAPDTDPKEVEAQKFARELSALLEKGLHDHAYERLILVAPPQFLGTMRDTVSTQVSKHIATTLDKDFTTLALHDVTQRLEEAFPDLAAR